MKAAIFEGKGTIQVEERAKPSLVDPTDAIVRVTLACVCGSDLWFYRGISDIPHGSVGHEFIGVVDEVGSEVKDLAPGDFVISPFSWSDGTCRNCEKGFHTACVNLGFFGQGGDGDGGQAEYVRVQQADGTLVTVPDGDYSDEVQASLLTLTDVMGTGYHAAVSAEVHEGDTVAVVGDGARLPAQPAPRRPRGRDQPGQGVRPRCGPRPHRRCLRGHGPAARHQGAGEGQRPLTIPALGGAVPTPGTMTPDSGKPSKPHGTHHAPCVDGSPRADDDPRPLTTLAKEQP